MQAEHTLGTNANYSKRLLAQGHLHIPRSMLAAVQCLLLLTIPLVAADSLQPTNTVLPWAPSWGTAFGDVSVVMQGNCAGVTETTELLRFDPAGQITRNVGTIPHPLDAAGMVSHGDNVFLFGGRETCGSNDILSDILRFSPHTGEVTAMTMRLPIPSYEVAAASFGSFIYVFTGAGPAELVNFGFSAIGDASLEVLRYDPANDLLIPLTNGMPGEKPVAVATDREIILLMRDDFFAFSHIWAFSPADGSFRLLASRVPYDASGASGVWDGELVHFFGGCCASGMIMTLDPSTGAVTSSSLRTGQYWSTQAFGAAGRVFVASSAGANQPYVIEEYHYSDS